MPVINLNFYFSHGDTFAFSSVAQTYSQSVINLTGFTGTQITCTGRLDPLDSTPVFTKTIGSGVTITSASTGQFTVTIAASDTSALPDYPQSLYYDVKVTDSSGNVTTVQGGKIYLSANISH